MHSEEYLKKTVLRVVPQAYAVDKIRCYELISFKKVYLLFAIITLQC